MKNLMLLFPLVCIMFTSCSKEEVNEPNAEQKIESAYLFKSSNNMTDWEALVISDFEINANPEIAKGNNKSLHAHGNFSGFGGGLISFSGTQNNGGVHGNSEIQLAFGPTASVHVVLETVSVVSSGDNEVIYGGQITEVIENTIMLPPPPPPGAPAPPCYPYELGTYVYFAVKDNGQGNNAPADQYSYAIFNSCNEGNYGFLTMFGFGDVNPLTDKIKVND